jgi:hypothetical protein
VLRPIVLALAVCVTLLALGGRSADWLVPENPGPLQEPHRVTVDEPPAPDDLLSQVVTAIARRNARAECDYPAGGSVGGYVRFWGGKPEDVAHLARDVCEELRSFPTRLSSDDLACIERSAGVCGEQVTRTIRGLHVISHESYHVAGVTNEAAADCYALQAFGWVARRLGASRPFSRSLLRYYWAHYAPIRQAPGSYWSDECKAGGELDLRDDDVEPPWAA